MEKSVWIVDDDQSIRWVLEQALKKEGIESQTFCDAPAAMEALQSRQPSVVVTDIRMPDIDGLEFLDILHRQIPDLPVVVMTAYSDLDTTVDSFQRGAQEHLPKPFDIDEAVTLIRRLLEGSSAATLNDAKEETPLQTKIIGNSPQVQRVFRAVGRLSKSDLNVLITGESGTGKELVARAIYSSSIRQNRPFVAINAAAIPADLLESELFGHEKGAFTGANQRRIGRFEQADGGTLFLDEIGDMPHDLQSRLLRVLSEGKFFRVGGVNQISVNVRVIAATNQDLEELIELKQFRSDLYHRLNVVRIPLPPIRERSEDIPPLVEHFLREAAIQLNIEEKTVSDEAMQKLTAYSWPGNVREIENVCRMVTVMTPSNTITASDLPLAADDQSPSGERSNFSAEHYDWEKPLIRYLSLVLKEDGEDQAAAQLRDRFETLMITTALEKTRGSRHKAATLLGWGRNKLSRRILELKISA